MQLKDKVIVVTGGAQGLGFEMAHMLAQEGAKLVLLDINETELQQAKAQLSELTEVKTFVTNVASEESVEQTFALIEAHLGGIDGLINNAGILRDGLLLKVKEGEVVSKLSLAQFQSVIDVNLTGVFLCAREAAALMVKTGRQGVIVNLSSVARGGNIGQTNYAASKAGVVAMTVTWARELGRYGIRVAAIAPGVVRTAMTDAMKSEARERLVAMKPVGRLGDASEIAHTAKYIFENDFFTARVVEVDGGISL